jgi:protein-S-isoprenylcysteine O-methyltransferase Ste14
MEDGVRAAGNSDPTGVSTRGASERSVMSARKHIRAILVLPGMVLLIIPGLILYPGEFDTLGLWRSVPSSKVILPIIGILCVCLGLLLMIATIRLFVTVGKRTLAPWGPPQKLVVRGVYRYVRNPMISGVLLVLLGESVLRASLPLFCLFVVFLVVNIVYIPLSEEPGLVKRFGDEYLTYKRNVPRWIPRLSPWEAGLRE